MLSIIILAIIQGIAEFLPISSSFHLIVFRDIFLVGKDVIVENVELVFDIALHLGTALAIVVYFFKDYLNIFMVNRKILLNIILATIPAAIFGVLLEELIENVIRSKYYLLVFAFIVMGIIIYTVDKRSKRNKTINDMSIKDSLVIGFSQVFALIPGFSRSGTTIATSRLLKYDREDSAKFSFYLSAPIVLGAVVVKLLKIDFSIINNNSSIFIVGILISFVIGITSIKYLLKYLDNNDFKIFMWYRLVFGIMLFLYLIMR